MTGRAARTSSALLLSTVAWAGLPLAADDPFRPTLALLPWVVAGLLEIGLWARQRGGRATPRPVAIGEVVGLAVLVMLILGREGLGLPAAGRDGLLAAGLLVLLAHRVARLAGALRPALAGRLPTVPPWPFWALPFLVYLAILPWSAAHHQPDGDEPYYLLVTHSLAHDFDAQLNNNYARGDSLRFVDRRLAPQPGDPRGRNGELYSRHNLTLPLLLAPAYRLAGAGGARVVMAALAAVLAWGTLWLAGRYFPHRPRESLAAWALVAFTPPLVLYSYQFWVEVPAAVLVVTALGTIHRLEAANGDRRGWLLLALPLVLLPLLKIRFGVVAVSLVGLAAWRLGRGRWRALAVPALALAAAGAAILLYNRWAFGNPLKYHGAEGLGPYAIHPLQYLRGLLGLFWDCAFGLFAYAPLWMLLLPAVLLLAAGPRRRRLLADLAAAFGLYLLLLGPRGEWFGAWSPPFRYGLVMLPLLGLLTVPLMATRRRPGARALLAALAALSLVLTLVWVVEPDWTYNLAHGRSHLLDHLSTRLGADAARFFPSSIRARPATWLWPPLSLVVVSALWFLPPGPRRRPPVWGLLGLLLAMAALPAASRRLPTRVVEFEDPWVEKDGGQLHPDLWVIYRPRFRGGWALPAGRSVSVPVKAGGGTLRLWLELRHPGPLARPATLLVRGGRRVIHRQPLPRDAAWREVELEPVPWRDGDRLVVELHSPARVPRRTHVILDRAWLGWE